MNLSLKGLFKVVGYGFLAGGGEAAELIAAHDWEHTSLGPIAGWPGCLKTAVSIVLRSNVPIVMLWGPDGVMLYNDAYAVFAGGRHPHLLGSKVREGWPEVAAFNDNVMKTCLGGEALAYRDQELTLYRSGTAEQVWMNLDYSPVLDEAGLPAGVIAIVVETTAKVAAERWLASERDRQRQMFDQAPGFIAMTAGPDHVFELTNAAYMQLVGHREILGLPARAALPEMTGQSFLENLDTVFASGQPFVGKSLPLDAQRTPGAPKEQRLLDLIYQPVRDPAGHVIGIFAQGQDVTDRVVSEEALRRSENQFRTFTEAVPNHVWAADSEGVLTWLNNRVLEYTGLPEPELLGDKWAGIVHADDLQATMETWQEAIASGSTYETEFRLRRRDGKYRWHIARAIAVRNAEGAIAQWIGTNTDIDDQKRAETALRESERRLQLSQKAAGIASLELDIASGTVVGAEGFFELWGLGHRDSVHISVLENLVIPEDRAVRSNPESRKNGTAETSVEYRIHRADTGEQRWLSRSIEFVRDGAGKPITMFGVMQDVTERREAQSRQQLLTYELEHRIKNILSMVTAIASQTFRNTDINIARDAFLERLQALAKAHDILNDTRWTNASMRQVIESTMAALPQDQIRITGPALSINPKMALSLSLAVNELATNAMKYGALSTANGTVTIAWSLYPAEAGGEPKLIWRWTEHGGPPVIPPKHRGFGSLLLERVFGVDFGGSSRIEYRSEGVECSLVAPPPLQFSDR